MTNNNIVDKIPETLIPHDGKISRWIFCFISLMVIISSLFFYAISLNKPYMGIALTNSSSGWIVESVEPNGAGDQAGITVGDIPIKINEESAEIFLQDFEEIGFVNEFILKKLSVVDSNGQVKTVDIKQSAPSMESTTILLAQFIVSLVFWLTAFYIFFKRPRHAATWLFCLCALSLGLTFSSTVAGERGISVAVHIAVISMLFAPFFLLHFLLVLPEERIWARRSPRVYLIYVIPFITLALYPLIGFTNGQPTPSFRLIRIFEFGIALLAAFIVAILNYVRATSPRTRQQMKIIFIGCAFALIPFFIFFIIPEFIFQQYFAPSEFSLLLVAFIPLAMGYAIVNQKLLNIDVFIRRSVIYAGITLVMASIVSFAVFFTLNYQDSIGVIEEVIIAISVGGIATALLGPVRNGIEKLVDKIFYKDRYDYRQIIQTLSNSLNLTTDATDASHLIVKTAVETLNLAGGSLFVKVESGSYQLIAARGILAEAKPNKTNALLSKLNSTILFPNSALSLHEDSIAYIVPIIAGNKEVGLLFLSPKLSKQDFSINDLYLIQSLSSISSVSLLRMLADARTLIERRQAEEVIKQAAEEWRATFDSISDMIATIDSNSLILRVNKAFADAVGASPQEIIGKHCYEVIHADTKHIDLCPHLKTLRTHQTESNEFYEPRLGKYIEVTTSPIIDSKQNITGSVHVIKDQTARRQSQAEQQRLREKAEVSSRLAAVGEMAAGVAHEINNPLTGIIGFSQLLAEKQDLPQDTREEIKVIADCSQRVAEIVKKLLTFARQTKPIKIETNLNTLIDNTLKLRTYVLSTTNIKVITNFDPALPSVAVDPGQIQQVILNLIVNAEYVLKKADNGGTITISSEKQDNRIRITFNDNGPGISPANIKRIFEPFFTTKPIGEGTGLGLSLSRSIILEHNGEMFVESLPDKGTTFTILLPIPEKPAILSTPSDTPPKTEAANQKSIRVLVVDDEAAIRKYLTIALTKLGHTVDSTADPDEVFVKLNQTTYDLIFLDIRLPGMSGITLFEKIQERAANLTDKIIIITGDTSSEDVKYFLKQHRLQSISKPFDRQTLERKINEILH